MSHTTSVPDGLLWEIVLIEGTMVTYLASRYESDLRAADIAPIERGTRLEHAHWMLGEIAVMLHSAPDIGGPDEPPLFKALRWIGYVQCTLVEAGVYSVGDLRQHTHEAHKLAVADHTRPPKPTLTLMKGPEGPSV